MRSKIRFLIIISFLICFHTISFSQKISTTSDNCPIIHGVEAKINYFSEQNLALDLPEDVANYLAGLLILNNYNQNNYEPAVASWLSKYTTLHQEIETSKKLNDTEKIKAKQFLENGAFAKVAELLQVNQTAYTGDRLFSSISTSGTNSPIIIGDYGNVSYVIKNIIKFDLPESLVPAILNQISDENRLINELRSSIGSKDAIIKEWVQAYKELEKQIAQLPKNIAVRANEAFKRGDFALTISIIEELQQSEKEIAKARYLKAKILLLDFKIFTEEAYNEIFKSFNISFTLDPNYENSYDYGKFLINNFDYYSAITPLNQSVLLASTISEEAFSLNNLGLAQYYSGINYIKGVENMKSAAKKFEILLGSKKDSLIFDEIININLNLAYIYAVQNQAELYKSFMNKGLQWIEKMRSSYSAAHQTIYYHSVALQVVPYSGDTRKFNFHLNEATKNIDALIEKDKNYYEWYKGFIYELAGNIYLSQKEDFDRATNYLERSKNIYRKYIGPAHIGALTSVTPIYRKLVDLYSLQEEYSLQNKIINEFQEDVQKINMKDSILLEHFNYSVSALRGHYYKDIGEEEKAIKHLLGAFDFFISNISENPYSLADLSIANFNKLIGIYSGQEKYRECIDLALHAAEQYGKHRALDSVYFARYELEAYAHTTLYSLFLSSNNADYVDTSLFYADYAIKEFNDIVMKYPASLYLYFEKIITAQGIAIEKLGDYQKAMIIHERACKFLEDIMKYNTSMVPTCSPLYAEQKISLAHLLLLHKPEVNYEEIKSELADIMTRITPSNLRYNYTYYYYYMFLAKSYNLETAMAKKRDKEKYEKLRCEYFYKSAELLEKLKYTDRESALLFYYDFDSVCN